MTAKIMALCLSLIPADRDSCVAHVPPPEPCISVTNYWPFTWREGDWHHAAWAGQADSDPTMTAYMHPVTADQAGAFVAAPDDLGGSTIYLPGWGELPVLDRFGHPAYRAGLIWHHHYNQWVLPVDVFTPRPVHYLECRGEVRP